MSVTIELITYTYVDANNASVSLADASIVTADILSSVIFQQDGPSVPVTRIGPNAFNNCFILSNVSIPSSVTNIGNIAFGNCPSLSNVSIPSSVTNIGNNAFSGCTSLSSITIPSSITNIGVAVFRGCTSLTTITIPSSVTSIGSSSFRECSSLTSITIPSSVTLIESNAFNSCPSLTNVVINNQSVTSVSANSFTNVSNNQNSVITFYNTDSVDNLTGNWVTIKDYYDSQIYTPVVVIETGEELLAFLDTEEEGISYANIVNSIVITSDLLSASYKQITGNNGIQIMKNILPPG